MPGGKKYEDAFFVKIEWDQSPHLNYECCLGSKQHVYIIHSNAHLQELRQELTWADLIGYVL